MTEADGTVSPMFPNEARLRNLTCVPPLPRRAQRLTCCFSLCCSYSAPLYIDMKKRVMVQESDEADPETGELAWTEEKEDGDDGEDEKVYIGKVSWRAGVGARGDGS